MLLQMVVGNTPAKVGIGQLWVEPDRLSGVGDGLVMSSLAPVGLAPPQITFSASRLEPDCFSEVGNGPVEVGLDAVAETPITVHSATKQNKRQRVWDQAESPG